MMESLDVDIADLKDEVEEALVEDLGLEILVVLPFFDRTDL